MSEPVVDLSRPIRIGGLMRCCVQTARTSTATHEVGEVLECLYCSDSLVVGPDGAWEWNREPQDVKI